MSIFLISPKDPGTTETNVGETNSTINSDVEPETKVPVEETPKQVEGSFVAPKQIDMKKIVLDGPLSQIYTQALNQMYARESYITEMVTIERVKQLQDQKENTSDDYLYVVDGDFLETDGYIQAFNSLSAATEHWKNVYVCVEHNMQITDRVAGFLDYSRKMGCQVISTRQAALEMMSDHLQVA